MVPAGRDPVNVHHPLQKEALMKIAGILALTTLAAACGSQSSTRPCPTDSGRGCAPDSRRVDLYTPTFSNPTLVTNPYYPISKLHSVVFTGTVDSRPFRTETTLLP